jgi:hypothetical protein
MIAEDVIGLRVFVLFCFVCLYAKGCPGFGFPTLYYIVVETGTVVSVCLVLID